MPKIRIYIIIMAMMCTAVVCKALSASACLNVEGQMAIVQGWPPRIRIESSDKKNLYGVDTNDEDTPSSDVMPKPLWKELLQKGALSGTSCVEFTGAWTTVPYDERVIKYVRIIRYKIRN
jgi:hypothetical protein